MHKISIEFSLSDCERTNLLAVICSTVKSKPIGAVGVVGGGATAAPPSTGKYIPPSQRGDKKLGERGESFGTRMQQDDQATVRVTNLSEETQESDLRELFGYFGSIKRVFLAKDKITQQSKVGPSDITHCLDFKETFIISLFNKDS